MDIRHPNLPDKGRTGWDSLLNLLWVIKGQTNSTEYGRLPNDDPRGGSIAHVMHHGAVCSIVVHCVEQVGVWMGIARGPVGHGRPMYSHQARPNLTSRGPRSGDRHD
ncbi:hypothetical protein An16g06880 [Aspergillus niger]|uniref:Uncharacterized protein n=2 Tax=Aspergillus niger TaxID=5061 RepID=A2R8E8_ASPNC|nr:hypothetical protein An16g06880 [Aspergillus niger]CAK47010.1 hypothetical protein An16g06880 [Aspergillus niger]